MNIILLLISTNVDFNATVSNILLLKVIIVFGNGMFGFMKA